MAKSGKNSTNTPTATVAQPAAVPAGQPDNKWHISSFRVQALIFAFIGLVFYANTFSNEYALDDNAIIVNNEYVQKGFAGIKDIFSGDALASFYKKNNTGGKLTGGRYRPLSIATFAIEQQVLGLNEHIGKTSAGEDAASMEKVISDMHVRHVVNVLLYIVSVIVLLSFLRKVIFKDDPLAAFLAAAIFLVLPVHTEVVANVKSRDEILSLLFILLTFIQAHTYNATKQAKYLIYGLLCFFLALLSKEYATMLLVLLPLSFYYKGGETLLQSARKISIYLIPFALYVLLRFASAGELSGDAGEDILNNPYLLATATQKLASIVVALLDYIRLIIFPYPLSADYSYNQIPYSNLSSPLFWLALVVYISLIIAAIRLIKQRHIAGFAIALYLFFLLPVSNLFINIGATKGERFVYHASLGFVIIAGWALSWLYNRISSTGSALVVVGGVGGAIALVSAFIVIPRNADWKNDETLFLKDVKTVPNSALANEFAGVAYLKMMHDAPNRGDSTLIYKEAIDYISKAIAIDARYTDAYLNRGMAYLRLGDYEHAYSDCDTVVRHFPGHPMLEYLSFNVSDHFFNLGLAAYQRGDFDAAFPLLVKAVNVAPNDPDLLYNVGFAYFDRKMYAEAHKYAVRALSADPQHAKARQLLTATTPVANP